MSEISDCVSTSESSNVDSSRESSKNDQLIDSQDITQSEEDRELNDNGEQKDETKSENTENTFKVPLILKAPKLSVTNQSESCKEKVTNEPDSTSGKSTPRIIGPSLNPKPSSTLPSTTSHDPSPAEKLYEKSNVSLPYKEPSWSGVCDKPYKFEIIKGGVVVSVVDLNTQPFYVVGRMSTSDIMLEHPSISRNHAVIQYRLFGDEEHPEGFYLYDLESTHGTTLNKQPVRPRSYYRLRVGYMMKFGGSTRMFILQGPDEDQDAESTLSVTELKELRKKHEEQLDRLEKAEEDSELAQNEELKDSGIDWGMREDAVEEEEDEEVDEEIMNEINPFALNAIAPNEDLYVDDPKKTLRGWFEREGYDLEYHVEEKGYSQFLCRIQLPLDGLQGGPTFAEAMVKGKKKEAVVACALEACRMLDKHGLLRQANHESRKRKLKNWEEEDYYDSDEDTFLDRTGTIEKKRQQRIQRAGKEKKTVETFETLSQQLQEITKEISQMEKTIEQSHKSKKTSLDNSVDSLDAYMSSIGDRNEIDKCSLSAHKVRLSQLRQEETRLQRLIAIAKPTNLPELKVESTSVNENVTSTKKALPMIGSMKGRGIKTRIAPPAVKKVIQPVQKDNSENEEKKEIVDQQKDEEAKKEIENDNEITQEKIEDKQIELENEIKMDMQTDDDKNHVTQSSELTSESTMKLSKHSKCRRKKFKSELNYVYDASNPDYALWMPPDNQSGDGRTLLNDKYGY